ncbi:MAG: RagB/SusD family nutrient uptake outer membrane protein [Chitinophagaceae bacterium]
MRIINYIAILIGLLGMTSCKKFLAEPPEVQADIQTAEQLRALLDNMTSGPFFMRMENPTACYSTDDYELPDTVYQRNVARFQISLTYYYTFNTDYIIAEQADGFWNREYNHIYTANLVLESIDGVSGSEELKRQLRADAHFIRAYSYFSLVNYYCLPYAEVNMQGPGLPLKTTRS